METAKDTKPRVPRVKSFVVLAIIIVAVVAGAYYYMSTPHAPPQFSMTVSPSSFHAAAGGGFVLFIQLSRVAGFTSDVNVTILNPPSWINAPTVNLNAASTNGTLTVPLSTQAQEGSYQLIVVGTAEGSADQTVPVSLKVVGVTQLVTPVGSALVYDTTKTLDASTLQALVSYNNGTFQFSQSTSLLDGLQPGDVIAASFNQTSILPDGFLRTVLDVHEQDGAVLVDTRQATLTEAAEDITFGAAGSDGASGTSVASYGLAPENVIDACNSLDCDSFYSQSWQPFGAGGINLGGGANLNVGETLQVALGGGGHISWSGIDWIVLGLFGHEEASAIIKGSAGDQFNYNNPALYPLYHGEFGIIPPILNLHLDLDLALTAFGTLLENVNTGIDQSYDLVFAVTYNANSAPSSIQTYCSGGGWNLCAKSIPNFGHNMTISPPRNPGSSCSAGPSPPGDCARIEIGPALSVGIDGTIGVASATGNAFLEPDLFFELDNQAQGVPVWSLYIGLSGNVGFSLSAGFNYPCGAGCNWNGCWVSTCWASIISATPTWSVGDFFRKDIWDAGILPPPTPTLLISKSADTITLANPAFLDPNMFTSWVGIMGVDPQGLAVTCIWSTAQLGQLGTSPAAQAGGTTLGCHGPAGTFPAGQLNQIISSGLTQITVTIIAEDSYGKESAPSNAVTVQLVPPTPQLQILCAPCVPPTITQNEPFTVLGRATLATVVSSTNPDGIIHLCLSEPQNIVWYVGGRFEADIVDTGEGAWIGSQTSGAGCAPVLTATSPGQTTIFFVLGSIDPQTQHWYIPEDINSNPITGRIVSVTVNVQAETSPSTPPSSGTSSLTVTITSPIEGPSSTLHTPYSNPVVNLMGTVSGGTPPYTATWSATYDGYSYTIDTFPSTVSDPFLGFPNDHWNIGSFCGKYPFVNGLVSVSLSITDSNHITAIGETASTPPSSGSANINCVQTQTISPIPDVTLVSLLTVLFAVTGEQIVLKLPKTPGFRAFHG